MSVLVSLREAAARATPGPWYAQRTAYGRAFSSGTIAEVSHGPASGLTSIGIRGDSRPNAEYAASSNAELIALLGTHRDAILAALELSYHVIEQLAWLAKTDPEFEAQLTRAHVPVNAAATALVPLLEGPRAEEQP